jgi:hypothetical protein
MYFGPPQPDVDKPMHTKDPLYVPNRTSTRSKVKTLKKTLNGLVVQVSTKDELGDFLEHQEDTLVHLIHV